MASVIDDTPQASDENNIPAPTANSTTNPNPTTSAAAKKRRIRFSSTWDILLLKAATAVDAHFAPHGEAQSRFEEALSPFKASLPNGSLDTVGAPTWKTLNDRFKKILSDHREAVKANAAASGIIEVRGERETLLDDVALEVDEWEEAKRAERDERTELDKRLIQAGEEVRTRALSRARSPTSAKSPGTASSTPSNRNRRKRALSSDSDDEDRNLMSEHIQARKLFEGKRLKIEEQRLEHEIKRDEQEASRLEQVQLNESRRIAVDEKRVELEERRFAVESEERKGMIAERKEVLSVPSALVKKLQ